MTAIRIRRAALWILPIAALTLAGCEKTEESSNKGSGNAHPYVVHHSRHINAESAKRGAPAYQQHCAECHGKEAEGHPRWQWLGEDGNYPSPPLNGSGHMWHHTKNLLHDIIKNGSPGGGGNMPAWKDKLSDGEIDDVIAWCQTLWPQDIYKAWYEIDEKASNGMQW
ncbi:MAG: cytochrome c [Mariprofundaceae bacterium]